MKITKKTLITLAVVIVVVLIVFAVVSLGDHQKSIFPETITADSECPVVGCTSDEGCHAGDDPPELKEGQTMRCPKVGCTSTECHAMDRITSHDAQPESVSLYLWIVGIPAFIILILLITKRK